MSQKNETTILVLSLLVAVSVAGGVLWWVSQGLKSPLSDNSNPEETGQQTFSSDRFNPQSSFANFAKVPEVPTGLFSYGGSTTWAPIRAQVDPVIQTVLPQFKLRYTQHPTKPPGSGTGIEMLLNNQLAFAQSSRPIKQEEYQQAQQRGFTLEEIPVAIDGIAIAVHPDLSIPGLTVNQLKDIYTGNITNWSQVGGPDFPIYPYSRRPAESGTIEFFVENVMGGEEFGRNIEFIETTTQALRAVSNNFGGIYYATAPEVVNQCSIKSIPIGRQGDRLIAPYQEPFVPLEECPERRNKLNAAAFQSGDYPLTRRLFTIVKQNGQIDQKAGEAYAQLLLTEQGQELIEQSGFVRIR